MTAYATKADVYKYGLPRGALGNPGRIAASALAANDTIELEEHGFVSGDAITVRVSQGGALPAPLVAGTVYYALPLTDSTFQVSATPNGSHIDLTTDGVNVIVTMDLPWDDLLEYYSRFVDGFIPAHAVPLTSPYPITVVAIVAQLVGKRAQILSGMTSESMNETEASAAKQMQRWATGVPARDATPAPRTNLAVATNTNSHRIGISTRRGRNFFPDTSFGQDVDADGDTDNDAS